MSPTPSSPDRMRFSIASTTSEWVLVRGAARAVSAVSGMSSVLPRSGGGHPPPAPVTSGTYPTRAVAVKRSQAAIRRVVWSTVLSRYWQPTDT